MNKTYTLISILVGYFTFVINFSSVLPILCITLAALIFDYRNQHSISPVSAVSWLFLFTGIIGYQVSGSKNSTIGTSFGYILPFEYRESTFAIFCLAALSLLLGAAVISYEATEVGLNALRVSNFNSNFIYWVALFPLAGLLIGFNPRDFLLRQNHLLEPNIPLLARLSLALSLIAVPAVAMAGRENGKKIKAMPLLLVISYGFCFFAMSSRALVVVPVSLSILFWPRSKRLKVLVLTLVLPLASYTALVIPLFLRSLNSNGLLPYLSGLSDFRFSLNVAKYAFQNFTVAFDLNGLTAYEFIEFPKADFFIQISPLLGKASGWYEISTAHRFNFATPTAALGELINYGVAYSIALLFVIGLLIGFMSKRISSWKDSYRSFGTVILYSGSLYFGTLCLQYNLRSAVRIIYYLIAVTMLMTFLLKRKNHWDHS